MQPNVPSFSRVVSSVGIGRTSTFDTNAMAEKDFETTAHNFLFSFSIFLSPSKNRSQLQQSQGTSSCCDEVILKTSFRGCDGSESSRMRSMDFPWRNREFPADNLATKSCCNHIHTSPPSPLPPYVEMLPRSPPQWVKCLMIQLRWKNHFLCTTALCLFEV